MSNSTDSSVPADFNTSKVAQDNKTDDSETVEVVNRGFAEMHAQISKSRSCVATECVGILSKLSEPHLSAEKRQEYCKSLKQALETGAGGKAPIPELIRLLDSFEHLYLKSQVMASQLKFKHMALRGFYMELMQGVDTRRVILNRRFRNGQVSIAIEMVPVSNWLTILILVYGIFIALYTFFSHD